MSYQVKTVMGLTVLATFLSGCTHHQVIVPISNSTGKPVETVHTATLFKGGKNVLVAKECDTNILDEVSIDTNIFHSLVNVVTLGTVSPLNITYICGKPLSTVGSMDDEE